jgi:hypothetical protein
LEIESPKSFVKLLAEFPNSEAPFEIELPISEAVVDTES